MADEIKYETIPEWSKPSTTDIVEELRWWEPQNIPWQLVKELRRRKNSVNIGQSASNNVVINFASEYEKYRGGMTPWVRVFSNGTGRVNIPSITPSRFLYKNDKMPIYDGFVLEGEKGFYKGYGYQQNGTSVTQDKAIIGYQANGEPHYIDPRYRNDTSYNVAIQCSEGQVKFPQNSSVPSVLPPPGITSVNIKTNKDMMSTAVINWKCYGLAQLEYMMPFFLTPKINVFIEFGWNLFDFKSLVNLTDKNECYQLIKKPEKAISRYYQSFGNYGLNTGIIWKYNFDTSDGFIYNCRTEVYSRQALWAGWRPDNYVSTNNNKEEETTSTEYVNLKNFFRNYLQFTKEIVRSRENFIDWVNNYLDPNAPPKGFFNKIKNTILEGSLFYNKVYKPLQAGEAALKELDKLKNSSAGLSKAIASKNNPPKLGPDNIRRDLKKEDVKRTKKFYDGKPENRIFLGRYDGIYNGYKRPESLNNEPLPAGVGITGGGNYVLQAQQASQRTPSSHNGIKYGSISQLQQDYKGLNKSIEFNKVEAELISYADKDLDFDYEESGDDEAWYQLDFVFELINLFCANKTTKVNYIDISDVVINAHPNLISCDKNVLIPNPIAPKINYGMPARLGGYLSNLDYYGPGYKFEDKEPSFWDVSNLQFLNPFTNSEEFDSPNKFANPRRRFSWKNLNAEISAGLKKEKELSRKIILNPDCIIDDVDSRSPLWKAAHKAKNVFKTDGSHRDNLDIIINKLYYDIGNEETGSASFPFNVPTKKVSNEQGGLLLKNPYQIDKKYEKYDPYYSGFLKHIYISKSVLIGIGEDESLKTLEQIVRKILNIINESVGGFWKLDVIINSDGGVKIVDKNSVLPKKSKIYMIDVGSTSNVIKEISFNVTLTNEQACQVLYGSGNNSQTFAEKISDIVNDKKSPKKDKLTKITQVGNSLPSIVFEDRLDKEAMKELTEEAAKKVDKSDEKSSLEEVPTGPVVDQNPEIAVLQKYGKQSSEVLIMSFRAVYPNENVLKDDYTKQINNLNWVYLNLPSSLKPKLQQMLDDGDTFFNNGKYAGPADNFTLSIKLDGMVGFRMFQYIAISNLPKPYVPGNVIFMITEVEHQINSGKWETVLTAMLTSAPDKAYEYVPI